MGIELIGLVFCALAIVAFFKSQSWMFGLLLVASLFQSSSAITLYSLGGSPISPGVLLIFFFILSVLVRRHAIASFFTVMLRSKTVGIYALFTAWLLATAFVMPRLFQGIVEVVPLQAQATPNPFQKILLAPSSGNITQSFFLLAEFALFIFALVYLRTLQTLKPLALAFVAMAAFNLLFVLIDLFTFFTGTAGLLDFVRNADYAQISFHTGGGFKRITGFSTEASVFAMTTVVIFAFVFRLWRGATHISHLGVLSLLTFTALIMSTSSTAYAGLLVYLAIVLPGDFSGVDKTLPRNKTRDGRRGMLYSLVPIVAVIVGFTFSMRPDLLQPINDMVNRSLIDKLASNSGVERMSWNASALQNALDTFGLGVGLGSVRASSFLVALIASSGLLGGLLFALFNLSVFFQAAQNNPKHGSRHIDDQITAAARSAMLAALIVVSLSGSGASPGMLYWLFAAIVIANSWREKTNMRVDAPLVS